MVSVLIVDDETGARTMLAMALKNADLRVETAGDGSSALEMIYKNAYDWVVSDVRLPGIDGIALAKQIARLRPQTHTLLISAVLHDDDVRALPIDGFWRKPFDPFDIQKFILEHAATPAERKPYALR